MLRKSKTSVSVHWPLFIAYSSLLFWAVILLLRWSKGPVTEVKSLDFTHSNELTHLASYNKNATKVMVVIGTIQDAIKLSPVFLELRRRSGVFVPILVSMDNRSVMLREILQALDLLNSVGTTLDIISPNQNLETITRLVLDQFSIAIRTYRPDLVLVQGDTTAAFAAALASYYEKIPVGHIDAGITTKYLPSPFPEEYNRVAIADIAQYHFVATILEAQDLLYKGREAYQVSVTGNTAAEALRYIVSKCKPSEILYELLQRARGLGNKVMLLAMSSGEEHFEPFKTVLTAIAKALDAHPDLVIICPLDLHSSLHSSIEQVFGSIVFAHHHSDESNLEPGPQRRLLLLESLTSIDMALLLSECDFIITSLNDVHEEAINLYKPSVIFCESASTGMVQAITCVAFDENSVLKVIEQLLTDPHVYSRMAKELEIYEDEHPSRNIVDILETALYPNHNVTKPFGWMKPELFRPVLVLTLTVWHRNMLEKQLEMIRYQIGLDHYQLKIIVFQNGNHTDVRDIISRWNQTEIWAPLRHVQLLHIHSSIETGYFGRFLAPLAVEAPDDGYFILFDDDIIWGQRYLENMLRVVKSGSLATRNGRFITPDMGESGGCSFTGRGDLYYDEDIEYDYGGHIWAGKIGWLRLVWRHPPPTYLHNEDFWISAVLKTRLGVTTKKPRCPHPSGEKGRPEYCACSAKTAIDHIDPVIGNGASADYKQRLENFKLFIETYDYKLITIHQPELLNRECESHKFVDYGTVWILDEPQYQDCYAWV